MWGNEAARFGVAGSEPSPDHDNPTVRRMNSMRYWSSAGNIEFCCFGLESVYTCNRCSCKSLCNLQTRAFWGGGWRTWLCERTSPVGGTSVLVLECPMITDFTPCNATHDKPRWSHANYYVTLAAAGPVGPAAVVHPINADDRHTVLCLLPSPLPALLPSPDHQQRRAVNG